MAKTTFRKRVINDKEYYFFRLRHKNLKNPKDLYAPTVKELTEKIKAITHELDNGIINNKEYFETFFTNWLFDVHFMNIKPSTQEKYEGIYRNYVKNSSLSKIKIKDITLMDIQEYYNKLFISGKTFSSIANLNKLIAPCIRYAYNNNLIIKDFTKAIVLPRESESSKLSKTLDVIPFTLDEQRRFISAISGHELEMLFIAALNTGLRQGELFALTWDDINFDKGYIDVNKTAKNVSSVTRKGRSPSKIITTTPKTRNSVRKVVMPEFLIDRLKQHKLKQSELKLKLANLYEDNSLVFCTVYGKYFDSSNVRKRLTKIIDEINKNEEDKNKKIWNRKFHDLRHTYATRLFELGEEPKTVQALLGHSDVSVTLNVYTHVLDDLKEKAISKLNNLYLTMDVK